MNENRQPEPPADLGDPSHTDFTGGDASEDPAAEIDAIDQEQPADAPPDPAATLPDSSEPSRRLTLQQVWKRIQGHPAARALAAIAGVLVIVFAIYDNSGLREAYPFFPTATPLPTSTSVPTAQPTATPTPTRTPQPTPTPLAFRPAAEGETLIVIAKFAYLEGADDTDPAGEIAFSIREAAKELGFATLRVEVDPTQIGRLERVDAEALGQQYGAAIVIWGEVSTVAVTTNFLNLLEPDLPVASVLIRETERTQSIQVVSGKPEYSLYITDNLPGQLTFLAFFAVGTSYYLAGDFVAAQAALEQAVFSLPDDANIDGRDLAYFALGYLYQVSNDIAKAVRSYDEAIKLNPVFADAYNNKGIVLHRWGDTLNGEEKEDKYKQAITSFERALSLFMAVCNAQGVSMAAWNLGQLYARRNDYAQGFNLRESLDDYGKKGNCSNLEKEKSRSETQE